MKRSAARRCNQHLIVRLDAPSSFKVTDSAPVPAHDGAYAVPPKAMSAPPEEGILQLTEKSALEVLYAEQMAYTAAT